MEHLRYKIHQKFQHDDVTDDDVIAILNEEEVTRLVPTILYLLIISLVGIFGNGLVCYIYRSKYTMSSSRWFIFFLGAVDLILCIFIIPSEVATMFFQYNFTDAFSCKLTTFMNLWSLLSLGYTLVIVSIDRYRKVCRPLGWQINFNKARILCACAVGLGFLASLPVFSVYGIYQFRFDLEGINVTASECSFRQSASESSFAFSFVLFGMAMFTGALATICILYGFIGTEIKQHIRRENIKRNVSLSASMAKRHQVNVNAVSEGKLELKSVRFNEAELPPRRTVRFNSPMSESSSTNDADEPSIMMPSDDDDTCDLESPVFKKPPKRLQKTRSRRIRRAKARKATFSMFLISVAFVLSYLPFLCLLLAKSLISGFDESLSDTGRAVYKFFLRSYFFNCAVNPFIYGISDSKFRENCSDVMCTLLGKLTDFFRRGHRFKP